MGRLHSNWLIAGCTIAFSFFSACQKEVKPDTIPGQVTEPSRAYQGDINSNRQERKILFIRNTSGTDKVYAMNDDGTNMVQLTFGNVPDGRATWSANGQHIAFASGTANNRDIYVMNANGQGLTNITNTPGVDEDWPEWSPKGNKVIFSSNRDGNHEIYEYDFDDGSLRRLTNRSQDDKWPTYSSAGNKIAFQSLTGAGNTDIFVMDADGSNITQLTTNTTLDQMPAWSPDDSKIIFMSNRTITDASGTRNWPRIFIMTSSGTNQQEFTTMRSARPSWSRSENVIVFTHSSTFPANPGTWEIYKIKSDGTDMTRLTNNSTTDDYPFIK